MKLSRRYVRAAASGLFAVAFAVSCTCVAGLGCQPARAATTQGAQGQALQGIYEDVSDAVSAAKDKITSGSTSTSTSTSISTLTPRPMGFDAWKRLAGGTAIGTMKAIVDEGWDTSEYAIVATSKGFQDALSASGLAGLYDCPILLSDPDALPKKTKNLLKSKKVKTAFVIGGTAALSKNVENQIEQLGISVTRLGGGTAVGTANKIFDYGKKHQGGWGSDAIVATAGTYQDALSIAPYAYAKKAPIFLVSNKTGELDSRTETRLKTDSFIRTLIIGGTEAVNSTVDEKVTNPRRLAGGTAYSTCRQVAAFCLANGMTSAHTGVATGRSYYDALCGAPMLGKKNSIVVLADNKNSDNVNRIVKKNKLLLEKNCYVFGGPDAISEELWNEILAACK